MRRVEESSAPPDLSRRDVVEKRRLEHARGDIDTLPSLLEASDPVTAAPRVQELWHSVWIYVAIIALLSIEWSLRRRWGLR